MRRDDVNGLIFQEGQNKGKQNFHLDSNDIYEIGHSRLIRWKKEQQNICSISKKLHNCHWVKTQTLVV